MALSIDVEKYLPLKVGRTWQVLYILSQDLYRPVCGRAIHKTFFPMKVLILNYLMEKIKKLYLEFIKRNSKLKFADANSIEK